MPTAITNIFNGQLHITGIHISILGFGFKFDIILPYRVNQWLHKLQDHVRKWWTGLVDDQA